LDFVGLAIFFGRIDISMNDQENNSLFIFAINFASELDFFRNFFKVEG